MPKKTKAMKTAAVTSHPTSVATCHSVRSSAGRNTTTPTRMLVPSRARAFMELHDAAIVRAARVVIPGGDHHQRMGVSPGFLERREDEVRRLSAGDPIGAIDDKERHTADTDLARLQLVAAHLFGEGVALEHLANRRLLEANLGCEPRQHRPVPHRFAINEGSGHQ